MKEQIEILEADVKRLQKEIAEAYAEVNDSRSVICNLENEVSKLKAENAELHKSINEVFRPEVDKLNKENEKLKASQKRLAKRIAEFGYSDYFNSYLAWVAITHSNEKDIYGLGVKKDKEQAIQSWIDWSEETKKCVKD
jgi:septal ring factor EnvC (AmiA/AmiB activator)